MRIWAKLITGDKIVQEILYTSPLDMNYRNYMQWVADICRQLDLSVPIIIPAHYKNFAMFHNTRFKPDDFVDELGCDMLMIENCKD